MIHSTRTDARRARAGRFTTRAGLLLAVILLSPVSPGTTMAGGPGANPRSPAPFAVATSQVDRLFARWDTTTRPGCTVGVSRGGELVLERAYGMADLDHGIANRPDTIMEAGSVSKQFTAAAVLLLSAQGKLSLDDPVRRFIPELPDYGAPITVGHLLTHTSGLRDWGAVMDVAGWPRTTRAYTHAHVLDSVGRQRALNYPPGTAFSYTNTGYNLAAVLVSRVSGRSFADFTRDALFEPLGLTRTSWRDDFTRVVRDRAVAYTVSPLGVSINMPFESVHGNGGLLTTVGDMLRWTENQVHARVGGRPLVDAELTRGRLAGGEEIVYSPGGLYITEWRNLREVSHSGGTAGYRAWLARYPDQRLAVAVLCNAADAPAPALGHQVAELFLGLEPEPPPVAVPLPDAALAGLEGLYRNRRTSEALSIERADRQLRVAGMGPLVPLSADLFLAAGGAARVRVARDSSGAARSLRAEVSGEFTEFDRVEAARPDAAGLQALAGTYVSDEAEVTLVVAVDQGTLVIRRRPDTTIRLAPTYADGFAGALGHVRFLRDAAGRVTHVSLGRDRLWDLRFARVPAPEGRRQ